MNLTPAKVLQQIKEFWQKQGSKRQKLIIIIFAAVVVVSILAAALLNHKTYTVLYTGLSSAEAGEILTKLGEMSVSAKVRDENTILVPKEDEARLKMQLAAQGYPQSAQSYDLFTKSVNFMTTDYEKRQYLIFQLQNRLQASIETLSGVKSAIVTISVPEDDSFVISKDKTPATASVVLDLNHSADLDKQQISGIEYLVANSVPGLDRKNVAIIDSSAVLLNGGNSDAASSTDKLSIESTINQAVEAKVLKLLQPVFGSGAIRVAVNTDVEVSQKVSQEKKYSPTVGDNGIISKQDQTQEGTGGSSTATGVPGTGSNTGTTTYSQQGSGSSSKNGNSSSSTEYLVNEFSEQVQKDGYEINDITVSVMIGKPDLADQDLQKYKQAVAFAAGISQDKISVTAAQFADSSKGTGTSNNGGLWSELSKGISEKPLVFLIAIVVLAALLTVAVAVLKKKLARKRVIEEEEPDALRALLEPKPPAEDMPGQIVLNETRGQGLKRQIKEFSASNPDIVAQLLRTWIKEE